MSHQFPLHHEDHVLGDVRGVVGDPLDGAGDRQQRDEPVVIGPVDLPVEDGSALIVYAVGSLDAGSVTALTESITGLGAAPEAVETGNSPVDNGVSMTAVAGMLVIATVAVGGGLALARRTN